MKITKFNVNRSKTDFSFKRATYITDGLMTSEDYIKLHSLEGMSGKNIQQINITGPDMSAVNSLISETQTKLANQKESLDRLYYITESQSYCGRVWDESNSSPISKTYCGNLEMLQNLPELLGLGGYLVQNDHTRRKLSLEDHYFFEDGSPAKLDGTMGHYQWGWNRPFYITTWNENGLFFECISFEPIKGRESYYVPICSMSCAGFATIDRETETLVSYINDSPRYRGGNNDAIYDTDEKRKFLRKPVSSLLYDEYMSAARKNGQGWYAGTMRMNAVVTILFHIIMGTRNSQDNFNPVKNTDGLYSCGLGLGFTQVFNGFAMWNNYNSSNPVLDLGFSVEKGDFIGESNQSSVVVESESRSFPFKIPIFYGLKNFYGHVWRFSEDEFVMYEGSKEYVRHYVRKSMYDDNYELGTANDSVYKETLFYSPSSIRISDISYNRLELFPTKMSATDSTYYCDNWYKEYSGFLYAFCCRGGYTYASFAAGLTCLGTGYSLTIRYPYMSTYLSEFTEDFLLEPIIS